MSICMGMIAILGYAAVKAMETERKAECKKEEEWLRENGSPEAEVIDCRVW